MKKMIFLSKLACLLFISCQNVNQIALFTSDTFSLQDEETGFTLEITKKTPGLSDLELSETEEVAVRRYFSKLFHQERLNKLEQLQALLVKDSASSKAIVVLLAHGIQQAKDGVKKIIPVAIEFKSPAQAMSKLDKLYKHNVLSRTVKHSCTQTNCDCCELLLVSTDDFHNQWITKKTNAVLGCGCAIIDSGKQQACQNGYCNHMISTAGVSPY